MKPELVGRVEAVCVGAAGELDTGRRTIETAFVKEPVEGRVWLGSLGLAGDEHVYEHHGGPDMAVLAYPIEHYRYWRGLGLQLPDAGAMAENFTVSGLVEHDVDIGDVYEVGSAIVQVCQPRTPCYKLSARYGRKDMSILVQDTGFAGYKLRVLAEGEVGAGDAMVLIDRDSNHSVSVAEAGRIVSVDRNDLEGARRVLEVGSLGFTVRNTLEARVAANALLGLDTDRLHLPDDVGNA